MTISRRTLLAVPALALPFLATSRAHAADSILGVRSLGDDKAPVTVTEWYSLTCPHCAAFDRESMPQIRKELIDTGKVRIVYGDFPLDQVALTAAVVARSLPPQRYVPFIEALFASQDRWAFARGVNNTDEIAKMAALAGMSRAAFDTAVANNDLRSAILAAQDEAQRIFKVDSTPSFIFNGPGASNRLQAGGLSPEAFAKLVSDATG
jgi:protein-disulfide isomerase